MTPADLSAALERLSLTPSEAARKLGVERSAMSMWLAGKRPIPLYIEKHIAALLELTGHGHPSE